jgi:hypothetical protein
MHFHLLLATSSLVGTWFLWFVLKRFLYKNPLRDLPGPVGESWWAGKGGRSSTYLRHKNLLSSGDFKKVVGDHAEEYHHTIAKKCRSLLLQTRSHRLTNECRWQDVQVAGIFQCECQKPANKSIENREID